MISCPIFAVALSILSVLSSVESRSTPLSDRDIGVSFSQQHTVDTGYAKYLGNFTPPYSLAFLGLPYAQPPVGNLRFRSPEGLDTDALSKTESVIDARSYPEFCVQGSIGQGDAGGAGTEDCLKVNVYVPVNATSESKRKGESILAASILPNSSFTSARTVLHSRRRFV